MEKKNKTYMTIVWIICLFISIDIGNHVLNFFTNIGLNVWIARIMGAIACILLETIFYYLWIKKVTER